MNEANEQDTKWQHFAKAPETKKKKKNLKRVIILGAFAKSRKVTISFFMTVCTSVCME